jgi:hypothetical protein
MFGRIFVDVEIMFERKFRDVWGCLGESLRMFGRMFGKMFGDVWENVGDSRSHSPFKEITIVTHISSSLAK